jgi:hypothetical protein
LLFGAKTQTTPSSIFPLFSVIGGLLIASHIPINALDDQFNNVAHPFNQTFGSNFFFLPIV